MQNRSKKRNTPIATLIRNYVDKKSGKVSESREEIKWRFNALDWKNQKRIIMAFLDAGKSDRAWAYSKILDFWDESFFPKVKELWESYHEYKCSWSVIRNFPLDYITEHVDEFTDERDYYFICLRLAQDQDFRIDRSRLSNNDYLALLYHTGREIADNDACDTLFGIVHDCCLKDTFMTRLEHLGEGRYRDVITPANFREVRLAIYYLLKLEKNDIVEQFQQWNRTVEETVYHSSEFKAIDKNDFSFDFEYDRRRTLVTNIYAFQALDDRIKQPSDPTVEELRDAYQKNVEWCRIQYEQSAGILQQSALDYLSADEEDTLPF